MAGTHGKYDGIDDRNFYPEDDSVRSGSDYEKIHPVTRGSLERSIEEKKGRGQDLTEEELDFQESKRKARGY